MIPNIAAPPITKALMISVIKPDHLRHHYSFMADLYQLSAILSNYYVIIFCYLKDLIIVNPSAASYKYKILIIKIILK